MKVKVWDAIGRQKSIDIDLPDGLQLLERKDILVSGQYCSIPKSVLYNTDLSITARILYLVLLDENHGNAGIEIGRAKVLALIGCGVSSYKTAIKQLEDAGLVYVHHEKSGGRRGRWTYFMVDKYTPKVVVQDNPPPSGGRPGQTTHMVQDKPPLLPQTNSSRSRTNHLAVQDKPPGGPGQTTHMVQDKPRPTETTTETTEEKETNVSLSFPLELPPAEERFNNSSQEGDTEVQPSKPDPNKVIAKLGNLWLKSNQIKPGRRDVATCLEKYKLQSKDAVRGLDPATVMETIQRHNLGDLEFSSLFQKDGTRWLWERLTLGKAPTKPKSKTRFTTADAEKIYAAYPRQVKKTEAIVEIKKALTLLKKNSHLPLEEHVAYLLEQVGLFAKSPAGQRGEYTPYPSNWFKNAQYLDDPKEWYAGKPLPEELDDLGPTAFKLLDSARSGEPGAWRQFAQDFKQHCRDFQPSTNLDEGLLKQRIESIPESITAQSLINAVEALEIDYLCWSELIIESNWECLMALAGGE